MITQVGVITQQLLQSVAPTDSTLLLLSHFDALDRLEARRAAAASPVNLNATDPSRAGPD